MDAAGPALVAGLVREGRWLDFTALQGGLLESLRPSVEALLEAHRLELKALRGALLAVGPGSTIGLRLAAMFLRCLTELPPLRHWTCLQYNNLELACAGSLEESADTPMTVAAPWRRDRLHLATFQPGCPTPFVMASAEPEEVLKKSIRCIDLGNRKKLTDPQENWHPYPFARIPELLARFPVLLRAGNPPVLYSAESPAFAPWSNDRHRPE